jgi:hypothetical protein
VLPPNASRRSGPAAEEESTTPDLVDHPRMTFDEAVAATQARLGERVRVQTEVKGRKPRTREGVLEPGKLDATEATPEEDGRVAFRLGFGYWFLLVPTLFIDAQEQPEGKLRVEMAGDTAIVIEPFNARMPVNRSTRGRSGRARPK